MFEKLKKIGIIIIIAILFSTLSFSIVDMIIEKPDYEDFCAEDIKPFRPTERNLDCPDFEEPTDEERDDCNLRKGNIEYKYDQDGCPVSSECNTCRGLYEEAGKSYRLISFIIVSIIGVLAIIVGLYITSKNDIVEWVYSGILIGGIANIFIGTVSYFQDMGRFVKPFILLVEMALIIWVAVRTAKKNKKDNFE